MTDITLDTITALNNAYPKTQYVDYSGFIDAFQPVLNDPSMYVPQQGLLQNTPTLADITLDPTIGSYSPSVTGLLQSYPQMEQDFQSTFAVDPNTYRNFETFNRLPFDKSHWENVVGGGGSGSEGLDLGGVAAAGTVGSLLLNNSDDDSDDGSDDDIDNGSDSGDGTSGGNTSTSGTIITSSLNNNEDIDKDSLPDKNDNNSIINLSTNSETDNDVDLIEKNDTSLGSNTGTTGLVTGTANLNNNDNSINNSIDNSITKTSEIITKNDANNIIELLVDSNDITANEALDLKSKIELSDASGYKTNFNETLLTGLSSISSIGSSANASNLISKVQNISPNAKYSNTYIEGITQNLHQLGSGVNIDGSIIKLEGNLSGLQPRGILPDGSSYFNTFTKDGKMYFQVLDKNNNLAIAEHINTGSTINNGVVSFGETVIVDDPRGFIEKGFDSIKTGVTDWLTNPINEGFGTAGTALNDATQFTGAEALSLGGGLLSLASALDEATPSNVFGTVAGIGASGLLGGNVATAAIPANAATGTAAVAATEAAGIQGAMTAPWVAPLAVGLFIAEKLQPDPSNKTGFAQFDAGTGETTSFGMEGDKYKEKNVEASTSIASAMGGAVNNITSAFGLTAEGDILAQTGNRDPLNITYGNQESDATTNDRLNYNTESGDIQSGDGIERWYYTGKDGFDGARLTSDLVHGTALLSLKAKANGEDSIDLANMTLPSRSADDVKNTYLSQGFDETAADALTSAARSASPATSELLGGLLLANTTNEANYLTPTERESLIGQGYTNEQLDTMLYGTTENSVLAINELLANKEENENNEENI